MPDTLTSKAQALYAAYPRKVGKRAAMTAIARALRRADFDTILAAVERYAKLQEPKRGTDDWKYVAYPATWFNQDRWEDEPPNGGKKAPNPFLGEPT